MIRVAGLDDARTALANTQGQAVTLISPPLGQPGLGWWRELVGALRAEFPDRNFVAVADCGPSAGLALAALRAGLGPVAADVPAEVWDKLNDIATQAGTWMAKGEDAAP